MFNFIERDDMQGSSGEGLAGNSPQGTGQGPGDSRAGRVDDNGAKLLGGSAAVVGGLSQDRASGGTGGSGEDISLGSSGFYVGSFGSSGDLSSSAQCLAGGVMEGPSSRGPTDLVGQWGSAPHHLQAQHQQLPQQAQRTQFLRLQQQQLQQRQDLQQQLHTSHQQQQVRLYWRETLLTAHQVH